MSIKVVPLSGFPELLPAQQQIFQQWIYDIREIFQNHGYTPIETPCFERLSTLTSKGIAEHEIYTVRRLREDDSQKQDDADLALRFDLTVPLARYVSQHYGHLVFPFRRHHIAPVWRGERPQKGRYRQLYQCDIDVLSDRPLSCRSDAEVLMVLSQVLLKLQPDIGTFHFEINHRLLLAGILNSFQIDAHDDVLRILDKRKKIRHDALIQELSQWTSQAQELIDVLDRYSGHLLEKISELENSEYAQHPDVRKALDDFIQVSQMLSAFGCPSDLYRLELSLARGLNYYTGIVLETFLDAHPNLGSIASGGRYDNLCERFSSRSIPGFGVSLGLSRLFHWYIEQSQKTFKQTPATILVAVQDPGTLSECCTLAQYIRSKGFQVDQYLEYENRNLGHQMKYADRVGIQYVIFASATEIGQKLWNCKDLKNGTQFTNHIEEILEKLS